MHLVSTSFNYLKFYEYLIVYIDVLILLLKHSVAAENYSAAAAQVYLTTT